MPPGLVRQWPPEFQAGFRYYRYPKLIKFLIFFGVMVDKLDIELKKEKRKKDCSICNIVIAFYSPNILGQETAKKCFGLRLKMPPAHLSTAHGGGFTLSL